VSKSAIGERKFREQWISPHGSDTRTDSNSQTVINRDANAAVRVVSAIGYRQAGWTYEQIAQQCGYASPGAARNAVQNELDRVVVQSVDEWRKDHTSRLEKMHEEVWQVAMNKKAKGRLFAFDRLLAISERQAKLLGLDAKVEDASGPLFIIEEVPAGYLEGPKE
jgi:AraC-like DNA-binding protein